jgi:transcriptional regulator with XRE-family HTH domain
MENKINWSFKKAYMEQGFTLDRLAKRTGIGKAYLSLFARGKYNLTSHQIRLAL